MNIYWEENERPDEGEKSDNKIDLSEVLIDGTQDIYVNLPEVVGGYDITGGNGWANSIVFNFVKKPNWFHRTCCNFFLGWKWNDKK